MEKAAQQILSDTTFSDNIDFYTTGNITEKRAGELEMPLRKQGLSVSVFDQMKMENIEQFSPLFERNYNEQDDAEIDSSFFDYLALSNDSTDIKNGFFYSLLMMETYRHQPVKEDDFFEICLAKYSRNKSDVNLALKNLRKRGKLTPLESGGVFSLTDDEQRAIETAIKESRQEESAFKEKLDAILRRHGLNDVALFYEALKAEYLKKYKVFAVIDDNGEEKEKKNSEKLGAWSNLLKGMNDGEAETLLDELKALCGSNDYMDQYGLVHSFLDLFRSDKYEGYIEKKQHYVYLDTPVVVNYVCAKSAFQSNYDLEWNNTEFN